MSEPFYTIGHSTLSILELVDALKGVDVSLVADVRTMPRSRTNPQFNRNVLPRSLSDFQIVYTHIAALGGLRGKNRDVPPDVNAFWRTESFHNYADYAMGDAFRTGIERLRELGHEKRCAVLCAEAVWWRCHRRIIADYLVAAGESVFHLVGSSVEPARLTDTARVSDAGVLTYPAAA